MPTPWKHKFVILLWIVAIVAAAVYLSLPTKYPPLRPGWTIWRDPGPVRAMAFLGGDVYCAGLNGVHRLGEESVAESINLPGTRGTVLAGAMAVDPKGRLWVGHSQGLSIRDVDGSWRTFTRDDGLPHSFVAALLVTRGGSVWIGTHNGAAEVPADWSGEAGRVRLLMDSDGLPHARISAMIEDSEGGIWFGTYASPEGGLGRLADGRWTTWRATDGLPHPNVTSLCAAGDGRVWAGCGFYQEGGAAVFARDGERWRLQSVVPTDELSGANVRSLYEDPLGRMWLGQEYDGITIRSGGRTVRIVTLDDGLVSPEVITMARAADGSLWLGTLQGAVRVSPQAVETLLAGSGNPSGDPP